MSKKRDVKVALTADDAKLVIALLDAVDDAVNEPETMEQTQRIALDFRRAVRERRLTRKRG